MSTTALAPASQGFGSVLSTQVSHALDVVVALLRAYRNRRGATVLAGANDRTLADLGLTRSDVRDAFAQPLWRDPTHLLSRRAGERRRRGRA